MKSRKTGIWMKILIVLTALCCTVTLVSQRAQLRETQAEIDRLTDQAAQLTQSIGDLEGDIAAAGTPEGIQEIAREQLGLAQPGEIIFTDTPN